jgi:hypothetical protein
MCFSHHGRPSVASPFMATSPGSPLRAMHDTTQSIPVYEGWHCEPRRLRPGGVGAAMFSETGTCPPCSCRPPCLLLPAAIVNKETIQPRHSDEGRILYVCVWVDCGPRERREAAASRREMPRTPALASARKNLGRQDRVRAWCDTGVVSRPSSYRYRVLPHRIDKTGRVRDMVASGAKGVQL